LISLLGSGLSLACSALALCSALVQLGAHLLRRVGVALALVAGDDDSGRGDAGQPGEPDDLP
jgi:hypothetical protein